MAGPLIPGRSPLRRQWRRGVAVVLMVSFVHGCVLRSFDRHLAAVESAEEDAPERLTAVYVGNMEARRPSAAAAAPAARGTPAVAPEGGGMQAVPVVETAAPKDGPKADRRAEPVAQSASAAAAMPSASASSDASASAPPSAASAAPTPADPAPAIASAPASAAAPATPSSGLADAASGVPAPAASAPIAASGPVFEWPASTRLRYELSGYYQGDIHGSAQVEWLRAGERYQVHLDVRVGLEAAPFMSRHLSSEGRITPEGLVPRRFDQQTRMAFKAPSRSTLRMDAEGIWLANGQRRERMAGVQDSSSQFVQLAWLFGTRPELSRPGATVEFPLALPRSLEPMVYEVRNAEQLNTRFGPVTAWHLVPRRAVGGEGGMSVEMWIAPDYRFLPMRLRIRQDAETFVDLLISQPPEIAGQQG